MGVHDWSKVPAGVFHDFHQRWAAAITNALNSGGLPEGYYALTEQGLSGPVLDVITLSASTSATGQNGGLAIADVPPRARFQVSAEREAYAARASRIVVRHPLDNVVA